MGAPKVSGPLTAEVVVVVPAPAPPAAPPVVDVVVEVWRGEVGVGEPEPQATRITAAAVSANPNCSR
jgi:hypothetical protein